MPFSFFRCKVTDIHESFANQYPRSEDVYYYRDFKPFKMDNLKGMLREFKQGHNAAETAEKICSVYSEGVITDRTMRNCFVKFCSGNMTLQDEPHAGRTSDIDDEELRQLIESGTHQSTRELAQKLNTSQPTICRHLEALGKVSKLERWASHALTEQNKESRMTVAASLLSRHENEPFSNG